jgi:outer membrane protein assembly factor BamA
LNFKQFSLFWTLVLGFCFWQTNAQELTLIFKTENEQNQVVIDRLGYISRFDSMKMLEQEIEILQDRLYYMGYISNRILEFKKKEMQVTAKIKLGNPYKYIDLYTNTLYFQEIGFKLQKGESSERHFVRIPIDALEKTLEKISRLLSNESYAFASVYLENIQPKNKDYLSAVLQIDKGEKRTLQDIEILGYEKFPMSYINHFLGIKTQKPFNLEKIKSKMELLEQLPFVRQKRPAEVLFTSDTTRVYLYLEKIKTNRFDGFLGFGSNEDTGAIEFDGYLDLTLNNNLNFGESFKLNYKSDENEQKTFDVLLQLPYLFGSPIGSKLNLNLFKKDSTFTTAQQGIKLFYQLNEKQQIGVALRSLQSNVLKETTTTLTEDYKSQFYGLTYQYIKRQKNDMLFPISSQVDISAGLGQRKTTVTTQQRQIQLKGYHTFRLNSKNSIFIKFHIEDLDSDQYLFNELIRIGGINSIRGFEENSIYASRIGILCTEYRYRLAPTLFVHSIIDAGYFQDAERTNEQLFGFGFGFGLRTNAGLLRFNYANGQTKNTPFVLSNSKVHLSLTTTF